MKKAKILRMLKRMIPYLGVMVVTFYLVPLLLLTSTGTAILLMIIILPFISFVCSVVYGYKNRFNLLYSVFVAALFVPTLWIYYNYTAWIYIVVYGIIALIGNAIGAYFGKIKNDHDSRYTV